MTFNMPHLDASLAKISFGNKKANLQFFFNEELSALKSNKTKHLNETKH